MAAEESDDAVPDAVDRASSKTPLDSDKHMDPAQIRRDVESAKAADQATSKSDGGSAPIEAKPNRVRERDDREKEPISEEMRSTSAHEQLEEKVSDDER